MTPTTRRARRTLAGLAFVTEMGRAEDADHRRTFAAIAGAADRLHAEHALTSTASVAKAEALLHIALSTTDRNIRDTSTCRAWALLSEALGVGQR